jgi:hypothetical protein
MEWNKLPAQDQRVLWPMLTVAEKEAINLAAKPVTGPAARLAPASAQVAADRSPYQYQKRLRKGSCYEELRSGLDLLFWLAVIGGFGGLLVVGNELPELALVYAAWWLGGLAWFAIVRGVLRAVLDMADATLERNVRGD